MWYFGMFRYSYHNQLLRRKRERSAITLRTCAPVDQNGKKREPPGCTGGRGSWQRRINFSPAGEPRAGGNGRNFSNPFFISTPAKSLINNTTSHFTFRLLLQLEGGSVQEDGGNACPSPCILCEFFCGYRVVAFPLNEPYPALLVCKFRFCELFFLLCSHELRLLQNSALESGRDTNKKTPTPHRELEVRGQRRALYSAQGHRCPAV